MATVIEYYVPEKHGKQGRKWIPPKERGKIIPFPVLEDKSVLRLFRLPWSPVFDFCTSNRHELIFDFMGEVCLESVWRPGFGFHRSRLFLIERLALARAVISS